MAWFACPYLGTELELTDERRAHIVRRHPELSLDGHALIANAIEDPDWVGQRDDSLGFIRRLEVGGTHWVVVAVREAADEALADTMRHWGGNGLDCAKAGLLEGDIF